ncbi:cell division protein ZapE [Meridianimarinicoccus roseus]|uniref:Cell division protein ZapE n=1 Tax=Meridianimarinicoccus roseus TaxID=2072018 RepID=A0A2V2LFD5_9RHOB|nr:cell division protein ZapE [Meridianimarinicoccus roseus]PWR04330.1 cell division protein ZapE [Meridianimarinicoccus roseus]
MGVLDSYEARVAAGTLHSDERQRAVAATLDDLRVRLLADPPRRLGLFQRMRNGTPAGLYIWGSVGSGKSMLVDLFVTALDGVPARRLHFHDFMQQVHRALHSARQNRTGDPLALAAAQVCGGLRVLVLDEMEVRDIADAAILDRLFRAVFDAGTVLVTTSNAAPGDLYRDGLKRELFTPFIELIGQQCGVVKLAGPRDYRTGRGAKDSRLIYPLGAAARDFTSGWWDRLAQGAPRAETVRVQGRPLTLTTDGADLVRAAFHDLCDRPLGPADYLHLAQRTQWLVLEDIPKLGARQHDTARRFILLIDALYEARTGLVASADAPPDALCGDDENAFAFARVVSRLAEMTAPGWPS